MRKTLLYGFLFALLLVAAVVAFAFEYGSPVSRRGVFPLQVTDHSSSHPATVTIDGGLISSALAVTSVRQYRRGRCVVVVVRESLVRPGRRSGQFHSEIAITRDIDEVAFSDVRGVIWHR
jgi:hypothetical protein